MRAALASLCIGAAAASAHDPEPGAAARDAASRMVALFADTCLVHAGDAASLRAVLASRHMHEMDTAHAGPLMVRPGRVYSEGGAGAHLAVLSFDNGLCGTVAEDVDARTLFTTLAAVMQARGITPTALGAAPAGAAQAYRLIGPGTRLTVMVDMQPIDGRTQASMLAAPMPPDARP